MDKAEGDRETAPTNEQTDDRTSQGAAHPGITNRADDEESENQERVPPRGEEKRDTHR
jgi:hypothetical protein